MYHLSFFDQMLKITNVKYLKCNDQTWQKFGLNQQTWQKFGLDQTWIKVCKQTDWKPDIFLYSIKRSFKCFHAICCKAHL